MWYHVAATYSETENSLRLYVNGTLATNATISPSHSIKTTGSKIIFAEVKMGIILTEPLIILQYGKGLFLRMKLDISMKGPLG